MRTDTFNLPAFTPADVPGARRSGADNPHQLENLAPDLAAEIDPTPADLGPMIELPDVETRIAGGLDGLDRGLTLLAVDPTTKAPIGRAQAFLDGRRNLTPAEVERHAWDGAFFAVCPEPSGLVIGDLDATDPAAAGPWAEHFTGAHVAPTRRGGRHAFYRRPDGTPARRVIHAEGRPVDVLGKGYVILWSGYAPEPVELPPDLAAVLDPPKPPRVPGMTGLPVVPVGSDRGETYAAAAISGTVGTLLALPDGQRQDGLNLHVFDLGRALKRASAAHLAGRAEDAIAGAVPWADTRKERDTIRRALAAGIAAEREGLPDRADWTPGGVDPAGQDLQDLAPNAAAEVERTRAAARARLDQLDQALDAIAPEFFTIHCVSSTGREFTRPNTQRRETTRLAATRVLERAENMARSTFTYGAAELAQAIGRGRASLIAAGPALAALGIESTPGRIGAEGKPIGRRWSVAGLDPESSAKSDTCPGAAPGLAGGEGLNVKCRPLPMIIQHSETDGPDDAGAVHIGRANEAAGELCRGARARNGDPAPPVELRAGRGGELEEKVVALGTTAHLVIDAARRLRGADVETIAETAGVSVRTAGETLRRGHVLGITAYTLAPTGKAGGQRKLWEVVEAPTAAVLAVIARGKWVIKRARDRARAACESFAHTLQRRVKETGRAAAGLATELAAELKKRAIGERAAKRGGDLRARSDLGRSEWIDDMKAKGAELIARSIPPAWAAGLLPLGTFADDWSADPDPVIAAALRLGGAVVGALA